MTKKSKPKLATMEDYAKAEFEPWTDPMPSPAKSRETFRNHYAILQLAIATMRKSKQELVRFWDDSPDDNARGFVEGLQQTEKFFTDMAKVCSAAEMRLLVAASAYEATATQTKKRRHERHPVSR